MQHFSLSDPVDENDARTCFRFWCSAVMMSSSLLASQRGQEEQRPLPDQVARAAVRPGHLGGRGHGRTGLRHLQAAVLEPQVGWRTAPLKNWSTNLLLY